MSLFDTPNKGTLASKADDHQYIDYKYNNTKDIYRSGDISRGFSLSTPVSSLLHRLMVSGNDIN